MASVIALYDERFVCVSDWVISIGTGIVGPGEHVACSALADLTASLLWLSMRPTFSFVCRTAQIPALV